MSYWRCIGMLCCTLQTVVCDVAGHTMVCPVTACLSVSLSSETASDVGCVTECAASHTLHACRPRLFGWWQGFCGLFVRVAVVVTAE